jgi:hypothetical protein
MVWWYILLILTITIPYSCVATNDMKIINSKGIGGEDPISDSQVTT